MFVASRNLVFDSHRFSTEFGRASEKNAGFFPRIGHYVPDESLVCYGKYVLKTRINLRAKVTIDFATYLDRELV
jgi:hypothetical protein